MIKDILRKVLIFLLGWEAKLVLKKYKPQIVVVIGSVGKTSAKDAIYAALTASFFVRKSEKSFNSEIGIPLAIIGRENAWSNPFLWFMNLFEGLLLIVLRNHYPRWLVLEVGADRPGDISKVAKWLTPDIIVMTRLPEIPVHVEYFTSPEALVEEKFSMVHALKPGGFLIYNGDDGVIRERAKKCEGITKVTFGCEKRNDFSATHYQIAYHNRIPHGIRFRVNHGGASLPVEVHNVLGYQHVYPSLAALAVSSTLHLNVVTVAEALNIQEVPSGRMRLLPAIKGATIIDDSYNSSPVAVDEALRVLENIKVEGKKIAVLGDMLELGKYSVPEHKRIGERAAEMCNLLVTVGPRARYIAEGALNGGLSEDKILQYEYAKRAGKELEQFLGVGDVVLIKGSQSMRMERVVEEIMAHPEDRERFLVRQDKEWQKR